MNPADLGRIPLRGVIALPSQPLGALQVVPLVRRHEVAALPLAALTVDGGATSRDLALVPHGVVTGFDESRRPRVAYGGHLTDGARMVTAPLDVYAGRREASARVCMAPLPLALEGLLLSAYGVRPELWSRFSQVRVFGADAQVEGNTSAAAAAMLRTFELEAHQCGALWYAADTLLAAFVAPSHAVYAALHRGLVADLMAPAMMQYLRGSHAVTRGFTASLPGRAVLTLDDLREALAASRLPWPTAEADLREGVSPSSLRERGLVRGGGFTLRRVITGLARGRNNAIGEVVHHADGEVAWLALHWLSDAQTRRAHLLAELAEVGWSPEQLVRRRQRGDAASLALQLANAGLDEVARMMGPSGLRGATKRRA